MTCLKEKIACRGSWIKFGQKTVCRKSAQIMTKIFILQILCIAFSIHKCSCIQIISLAGSNSTFISFITGFQSLSYCCSSSFICCRYGGDAGAIHLQRGPRLLPAPGDAHAGEQLAAVWAGPSQLPLSLLPAQGVGYHAQNPECIFISHLAGYC